MLKSQIAAKSDYMYLMCFYDAYRCDLNDVGWMTGRCRWNQS